MRLGQPSTVYDHRRMDSQTQISDAESQPLKVGWLRVLTGIVCVLPYCVQACFFNGGFYYDDAFHLEQCRMIDEGTIDLADYVLLAHGEHLIPVWKLMFCACWFLFGENSAGFHFVVTAFHVGSALLLLAILRRYTTDLCAAVASVLWAGAAIGGWDGPFLWIAASHLSIGSTFFLGAMFCVARFGDRQDEDGEIWSAAMAVCLMLSLLTMGSLIVLTPALLLQFWLLERTGRESRAVLFRWGICFVVPCLLVAVAHLVCVLPAMQKLDRPATDIYSGIQMLGGGYAAASWKLFLPTGNAVMWGRLLGFALIAWLLFKTTAVTRNVCLIFFVLSFCFSLLAYMARSRQLSKRRVAVLADAQTSR